MTQPPSPPLVTTPGRRRRGLTPFVLGLALLLVSPLVFVTGVLLALRQGMEPTGIGDIDDGGTIRLTAPMEVSILAKDQDAPGAPPTLPVRCDVTGPTGKVDVTPDPTRTHYQPNEDNRLGYFTVPQTGDYRLSCPPFTRLGLLDKTKLDHQMSVFSGAPGWAQWAARLVGMTGLALVIYGAAHRWGAGSRVVRKP